MLKIDVAAGRPAGESKPDAEARIEALKAALAEREDRLVAQEARNAELVEQVSRLVTQIEVLTEQLRYNSKNSRRPPSSDGPVRGSRGASCGSKKPKSKRKRGGQTGHRGAHRELLAPEAVDDVVELFPDVRLGCAAQLPRVVDDEPCRYQQLDLRDRPPHMTEFRRHAVACPHCWARTRAAYDARKVPVSADIPRLSGSCEDMLAHRDALWTFVERDDVEPTNNHAERECYGLFARPDCRHRS